MRVLFPSAVTALLLIAGGSAVFAADMKMSGARAMKAETVYRFELAGPARSAGAGKSTISVKLIHNGKPVTRAIIIQSRADMGPMGMAAMTAPIKALGEQPPGIYRFEVQNGPVWKQADNWALSFSAKVQGVMKTVSGSVTVRLAP